MNIPPDNLPTLFAGTASRVITPELPVYLYGYPHAERVVSSANDPLEVNVLFIRTSSASVFLISCDLIFIPNQLAQRIERRLGSGTVLIGATHTHSGPSVTPYLLDREDPTVHPPDPNYLLWLEDTIESACRSARAAAKPAEIGFAIGSTSQLGGHRHDPARSIDRRLPILAVREANPDGAAPRLIGILYLCAMHPTVLHEDFLAVSADFPGAAREHLRHALGPLTTVVHWAGACGDLSPRHAISANTLSEARRLGTLLGEQVRTSVESMSWKSDVQLSPHRTTAHFPPRTIPNLQSAYHRLHEAESHFRTLQTSSPPPDRATLRTAECDVFGARCLCTLARAHTDGALQPAITACQPAEVTRLVLGPWELLCVPGEWLTEPAQSLVSENPDSFVATLINGELQGYIASQEAIDNGWYESGSALFDGPASARIVRDAIHRLRQSPPEHSPR